MTLIVMALAMVLGFTQCKKEQPVPQNENQAEGVRITLNLGDDNSKVVVTPGFYNSETGETYAKVEFEAGDVIYVGNNGAYCGYLEYNGSTNKFEGEVTPTSEDDYLHFYFMGNKGAKSQPSSVSITDQTSKYPVISYAHSSDLYNSEVDSYSARLENYCAIAKFPLSGEGTTNTVYVRGMNNTVEIDFTANNAASSEEGTPYTFKKEGNGTIKLHSENATEKWAILLEQGAVTADLLADGFEATTVSVPAIVSNTYHASDIAATSLTAGSKVCYSFTVDDKGSVVRFSKGNLQYNGSTSEWGFAENQYNYTGTWNASSWVDLFGWGTWGYGKDPLNTSGNSDHYSWSSDFQGTLDGHNDWRTLSKTEWSNLCSPSTYGMATVNGIPGVIILPNGFSSSINTDHTSWGNNTIDESTWTSNYEAAGAVFLPAAGWRTGTTVNDVGDNGCYWSSTPNGYKAYEVDFVYNYLYSYDAGQTAGMSVRLVR